MIRVRAGSGNAAIKTVRVRLPDGATKAVMAGSFRAASALKRFFTQSGAITATAVPPSLAAFAASDADINIVTGTTTVTPSGGAAPYTYAWSLVSSTGGTWSAQSPTAAATKFVCASVAALDEFSAVFRCTITDSFGGTGEVDVSADVTNLGGIYR